LASDSWLAYIEFQFDFVTASGGYTYCVLVFHIICVLESKLVLQ